MTISKTVQKTHYQYLAFLLRILITGRFKRMARDEVLFKFISSRIDPALLVDQNLQAEREALDLAEMSLLKLVDSDRMAEQVHKSATKIQSSLRKIYGDEVSESFLNKDLVSARTRWIESRIYFYRKWLSIHAEAESPIDLAGKAFKNKKGFVSALDPVLQADRLYADEMVKHTKPLFRFLMKKQMDYELKNAEELWEDFQEEAFKKMAELP